MIAADLPNTKITSAHRAKLAYIYIRQSSLAQVTHHGESTELQYRLIERAATLGWPRDRVKLIDDDLGKSAASSEQRFGFQLLIADISLAQVGLVLSWDASRLARNNGDWHRLIELCSLFGTLIADGEQLYDPRQYHDRLLLGLSGMMSEAELHQLTLRLHAGSRQKAERGELPLPLPAGLERQRDGTVILTPDDEVQARLRLVFDQFDALGNARAVMRYLRREKLLLPTRPLQGPAPHPIVWQPATASRVSDILHNPAYAGAYTYGKTTTDPTRRRAHHPTSGTVLRSLDQWPVCLQDRYPAYITWERYMQNRQRLKDNQNRFAAAQPGVARQGRALLQGIIVCGRCGARMQLCYSGSRGEYPIYVCRIGRHVQNLPDCQTVRAPALDAAIERHLFAALEPDKLALALAALEQLEHDAQTLQQHWQLRLERARFEVDRAQRQYHAVEPENRLVARQLETRWEEKLRALDALKADHQRWLAQQPFTVTASDREAILALGQNLPAVWHAPTTTHADRKQLVRLVIKSIIVDAKRERGQLCYTIHWQTGATSEYRLIRSVNNLTAHAKLDVLQRRIHELNGQHKVDADIAAALNAEGLRTAHGLPFDGANVWRIRQQLNIPSVREMGNNPNPRQWSDGTYSIVGVAKTVGVSTSTVRRWLREGHIKGRQVAKTMPWKLAVTKADIAALKARVKKPQRNNRSTKEAT